MPAPRHGAQADREPDRATDRKPAEGAVLPSVTVIMPVRNEADAIEAALSAVLAQDYPRDRLQILVVDGRSDDDTRERVQALARAQDDVVIEIVDNPGLIAPCALNAGLARARGEIVVRVDGHCEIGPQYVRNGVRHLQETKAAGVGGILETVGETAQARAIAAAMSSGFGVGGSAFRTSAADSPVRSVDTVAFPAYRRSDLSATGPFDEELVRNQDDEYNYRLRKAGHIILLVPDMPVRYHSRARLGALARQYFQYGYWKVRVLQKHPRQMSARQFAPPLLAFALTLSLLAGVAAALSLGFAPDVPPLDGHQTTSGAATILLVIAALPWLLYLVANLVATAATAIARRVSPLTLSAAFAAMHLGYGAGFLVGLVRFAGRFGSAAGQPASAGPQKR